MSALTWHEATLVRMESAAPHTLRYWFEAQELASFDFKPGQFVTLDLPIHEKPNKRWRSYSIASWPDGSKRFELIIVRNEEGAGTNYLFEEAVIGSVIPYRGPQGVFVLPETLDQELFLICTGTGIAPFRSMIHQILKSGMPHREIHLVFGTRNRTNLLYHDEMTALAAAFPSFQYHPVLSRENWEGETGYVHVVYERLAAQHPQAAFYLCGWKEMIREARDRIEKLGYSRSAIHQEIYG
jgi:glycine betaine catabolism B